MYACNVIERARQKNRRAGFKNKNVHNDLIVVNIFGDIDYVWACICFVLERAALF